MGAELPRSPLADAIGGVVRAECKRQGRSEASLYRAAGIASSGRNYFSVKADRAIPFSAIEAVSLQLGFSVSELVRLAEDHVEPLEVERFVEQVRGIRGLSDADRQEILRSMRGGQDEPTTEHPRRHGRAETGT